MTRLTIHTDDLADALFAVRAVRSAAAAGHEHVIFTYGEGDVSVFVRKTPTGGYVANVASSAPKTEATE